MRAATTPWSVAGTSSAAGRSRSCHSPFSSFATAPESTSERIDSSMKKGLPPARATILSRSSSRIQSKVASMMRAASSSESGSSTSWGKFVRTGRGSGDPGPARCARRRRIGTREAREATNQSSSSDAEAAKCRSSSTESSGRPRAGDARRVTGAHPVLGRGREPDELGEEAALADPRLAGDEHDLSSADPGRLIREVEPRELHPSSDEWRLDVDRRSRRCALAGQRVGEHGSLLPLHLDGPDLAEAELAVGHAEGRLRHIDLAGRGGLLETRRRVHGVAHHAVLRDAPHGPGDDHPGMDADAQAELDPELDLDACRVLVEGPLHPERAAQRALRIVLVRDGRTEDHEDGVADEFLDRPVVPERLLSEILEDARDEHLKLFRIEVVGERRKADEVGEEHRHETALLIYRRQCL